MKRREFLTASVSTIAATTLPEAPTAQPPAAGQQYPVGDFILQRTGIHLHIVHRLNPEGLLWESAPDGNFIIAEMATANIRIFGTPEGSFEIRDTILATYDRPSIDAVQLASGRVVVLGRLAGGTSGVDYKLTFDAISTEHLRFEISVGGADAAEINRIRLRSTSTRDEAFFGFGHQLTDFNQKGNLLPILVQEHGVGRGRPIVTQLVDIFASGGGGNPYVTEAPAPHFISSRLRSLFLENKEYSVFDLRPADAFEIKVWSAVMAGRILYGETPLDLIRAYTEYSGRMRVLPDWIHNGVLVAVQGGTQARQAPNGRCPSRWALDPGLDGYARHVCGKAGLVELAAG
jgi:alpha-glucosidase